MSLLNQVSSQSCSSTQSAQTVSQESVERLARSQSRSFRGGFAELSMQSGDAERPPLGEEESPSSQGGVLQRLARSQSRSFRGEEESFSSQGGVLQQQLPYEIWQNIFGYLSSADIQSAACVSHSWNSLTIDVIKHEKFVLFVNVVQFLKEYVNTMPLDSCIKELHVATNCIGIQAVSRKFKEKVIELLTNMSLKELDVLKNSEKNNASVFKLLNLSVAYKKLKMDPGPMVVRDILLELAKFGDIDQAIAIALTMSEDESNQRVTCLDIKCLTLRELARALARQGRSHRAVELANAIPHKGHRCLALKDVEEVRSNGRMPAANRDALGLFHIDK